MSDILSSLSLRGPITAISSFERHRYITLLFLTALCIVVPYDAVIYAVSGNGPFGHPPATGKPLLPIDVTVTVAIVPVLGAMYSLIFVMWRTKPTPPRTGMIVKRAAMRLPVVAIVQAVTYVAVAVAGIFVIVPGIILWVRWLVASAVAAVEQRGIVSAFRRSVELTAKHQLRALGTLAFLWLGILAISVGIRAIETGASVTPSVVLFETVVHVAISGYIALILAARFLEIGVSNVRN